MSFIDCLAWLAIGAVMGWIPGLLTRIHGVLNILLDVAAGAGGAFVGGMLMTVLQNLLDGYSEASSIGGLLAAFGGALIVLSASGRGRWANNESARRHRRLSPYLYN